MAAWKDRHFFLLTTKQMANKQTLETLLTEDILESIQSCKVIEDDETYEDYIDSFTEDDPF